MSRLTTVDERIGDWARAFDAVRREITPDKMRQALAEMNEVDGIPELSSYMNLANIVSANDRIAAQVAATLTPIATEKRRGDDGEEG